MWSASFYVNSLNFQQWNSNWDIAFFNSSLNSKLRFLNAGLIGLHNFFQFMKVMKYWGFWMLTLTILPNFSQFTEEFENWYLWVLLTFTFCRIVRTVFQTCYVCRKGHANLWLNCQFSRKEIFINVYATNLCQFKWRG